MTDGREENDDQEKQEVGEEGKEERGEGGPEEEGSAGKGGLHGEGDGGGREDVDGVQTEDQGEEQVKGGVDNEKGDNEEGDKEEGDKEEGDKDTRERTSRKSSRRSHRHRSKSRERKHRRRGSRSKDREGESRRRRSSSRDGSGGEILLPKGRRRESSRRDGSRSPSRRDRDRGGRDRDGRRYRERERTSSRRSRSRSHDRRRGSGGDSRRRGRDRDRSRDRDSGRRSSSRHRHRSSRRERSRSHSRHSRKDKDKEGEGDKKKKKEAESGGITLEMVMRSNPGIGVVEALQKLTLLRMSAAPAGAVGGAAQPNGVAGDGSAAAAAAAAAAPTTVTLVGGKVGLLNGDVGTPGDPETKPAREIYVGSLPPGITGPQLQAFLGAALEHLKLTAAPGNPIRTAWISADARYAFCEFRSIEECNASLKLNGIQYGTVALKIGRPKSYTDEQVASAHAAAGVAVGACAGEGAEAGEGGGPEAEGGAGESGSDETPSDPAVGDLSVERMNKNLALAAASGTAGGGGVVANPLNPLAPAAAVPAPIPIMGMLPGMVAPGMVPGVGGVAASGLGGPITGLTNGIGGMGGMGAVGSSVDVSSALAAALGQPHAANTAAQAAAKAAATAALTGGLGMAPGGTLPQGGVAAMLGLNVVKKPTDTILMLTNLPQQLAAEQVKELVSPFGSLKRFNLLIDSEGNSKGIAVFEYEDASGGPVKDAEEGLHGLTIAEHKLVVQGVPASMAETLFKAVKVEIDPDDYPASKKATAVIRLKNMVKPEELDDDAEFEDIKQDVTNECAQHGKVLEVAIPRPHDVVVTGPGCVDDTLPPGCGKIFVKFENPVAADNAKSALQGKTFGGKFVKAEFYPLHFFNIKQFGKPKEEEEDEEEEDEEDGEEGDAEKKKAAKQAGGGGEQAGVGGFVMVGASDPMPSFQSEGGEEGNGAGGGGAALVKGGDDDDAPPDFDAMDASEFESNVVPVPGTVVAEEVD